VVHRTLAAMLASTMSIAILAALNERPTMDELISWIDVDTLLLLFSMMILVAVVAETGIFDWLAVYAYKITGGKLWPLVGTLCFFTAFVSSILDNVTTVLLMTPVTIRLCEVMEINPVPILTAMVVYSNIGGAMTPIGDPPNVIIASNRDVINNGIDFSTFTLHMSIGVILVIFVVYAQLRFIFRDIAVLRFDEPQDVQELRHEIAIWQRAAASLSSYSKDENLVRETLMKKVQRLLSQLKKKLITGSVALERYKTTLEELQEKREGLLTPVAVVRLLKDLSRLIVVKRLELFGDSDEGMEVSYDVWQKTECAGVFSVMEGSLGKWILLISVAVVRLLKDLLRLRVVMRSTVANSVMEKLKHCRNAFFESC
ncbi:PREDICTED: P protein-like, partial [Habropoda laboriosa]|uniref:P protein-like n=1 Tax=Habropoda laboriosa TaxID=597456 RepID=UPI00083CD071